MKLENRFCTFYVNGMLFGIAVENVREVVTHHKTTPVPLARPEVEGLMNQRGQVVVALDLRRRLGFPERAANQQPMIVSVICANRTVNLLVDEIGDMVKSNPDQWRPVPPTLQGVGRDLITGAFTLKEKLLLVLDLEKTVDLARAKAATAHQPALV
ncbi:MAG TPA: chemotaxis protein CheW [Candidatus Angelobacter sp.]|nr:chemotaxis protein CheW [Candidatus Angelobacter sp.]